MLLRFVLALVLSGLVLCGQTASSLPHTPADAEKLEAELDALPDDIGIRVQLIRYYFQSGGQSADRIKPLRRKHILWMIEHRPEHSVLSESAATLDKSGHPLADPEGYAAADAAWRKHFAGDKPVADTFANAASFYKTPDLSFALQLVEDGLKAYPGNARIATVKGTLLAYSILGVKLLNQYGQASSFDDALANSDDAVRFRQELETATDPNLLGGAGAALTQQAYPLISRGMLTRLKLAEDLSEHCYRRAIELDPDNPRWKSGLMSAYQAIAMHNRSPGEKIELLEKAVELAPGAVERGYVLTELSQQYFNAGKTEKASEAANELLNTARSKSDWNYGNAIHTGNIVLGRIALKQGHSEEAGRYLLAAGGTPGSPQLNSFGPNWTLAQDLLSSGDRTTVLAYLDLCSNFWKMNNGRLDSWAATIRSGGSPNFNGPLEYPRGQFLGKAAPDFRLKSLKAAEVTLSEFKGKVVLVDFWATWCAPCRAEMPDFQKIHRELSDKDVVILAVDVNEPRDTVAGYIDKEKYTFPVLLAEGSDVVARYSVNAYPTLFAVDKSGRIADILVGSGSDNSSRLMSAIEKARAGAPTPAPDSAPPVSSAPPSPPLPPAATAEDFYREGVRLRNNKDLAGAIKAFGRAMELRKDWTLAILACANCQYQLKQYDAAIANLNRAIELNPKHAPALDERGRSYSDSDRHAQAIPDYTRALEINPDNVVVYNNRGRAYLELGRLDQSLSDLNRSVELNPAYAPALKNRARLYTIRKDYAKAVADYDALLRVNPGDAQAAASKASAQRLMNAGTAASSPSAIPLSAPRLLSPANGTVFEHFPRETTLVWSEVAGAAGYEVEWDYQSGDTWTSDQRGTRAPVLRTTEPVVSFRFVGAQPGRWRVWAVDADGNPGPKSDWREFRYTR